ncbi:hypothetical protein ACIBJF_24375 [Streptomyces sp. NPDC050743]|uniref:hypothetical protein n=1 Tax=Streptomyces sp. NPDC050743 TaxID=3365634 RepID=UPI0037AD6199
MRRARADHLLAQGAHLMGESDGRVTGAARHPEGTGGHPPGLVAARFDCGGRILVAAVICDIRNSPRPLAAVSPTKARPAPARSPGSAPAV